MVRNIEVVKIPRKDEMPDKPINFPPLENLHLELVENKKKLIKGLPLIPVVKKPPKIRTVKPVPDKKASVPQKKATVPPKKATVPDIEFVDEDGKPIQSTNEEEEGEVTNEEEEEVPQPEEEVPEEHDEYAGLTQEQIEEKMKQEYIFKWRMLKRTYGRTKKELFPDVDYDEHSDFNMMKSHYDRSMKELYLDDTIKSYRTYMTIGFFGLEYVCTQWMGIDMDGFAKTQISQMDKYNRLLIELGEKSYMQWGSNFPVELRLMGMILFQGAMFYMSKKMGGNDAYKLFSMIMGENPNESHDEPKKEKKMRGPKLRPEDIV